MSKKKQKTIKVWVALGWNDRLLSHGEAKAVYSTKADGLRTWAEVVPVILTLNPRPARRKEKRT